MSTPPSSRVLTAFSLPYPAYPLKGGQNQSFTTSHAILKPSFCPAEASWAASILLPLSTSLTQIRIPTPLLTTSKPFVCEGWTACTFVAGVTGPVGKWKELLAASRVFHAALRPVLRPQILEGRRDGWARADRIAWEEEEEEDEGEKVEEENGERGKDSSAALKALLYRLTQLRRPVVSMTRAQVVHGDLAGNVLFASAEGLAPAIIDFSPYWRPVVYAKAIVVADGILEWGMGRELVELVGGGWERGQMLVRALVFRLLSTGFLLGEGGVDVGAFERAVGIVEEVVGVGGESGMEVWDVLAS